MLHLGCCLGALIVAAAHRAAAESSAFEGRVLLDTLIRRQLSWGAGVYLLGILERHNVL